MSRAYDRLIDIAAHRVDLQILEEDKPGIRKAVDQLLSEGWTDDEIVAHCRNMEEVNPELPEEIALKRMSDVRERVLIRLKGEAS